MLIPDAKAGRIRRVSRPRWACALLAILTVAVGSGSHAQLPGAGDDVPQASPGDPARYEPKDGETVADVKVVGNRRKKEGEIFRQLQTRSGTPFNYEVIGDDVRRLVRNLQFVDVKTLFEPSPEGVIVTYRVVERPTLEAVEFVGNKKINKEKLLKESGLSVGGALDLVQISEGRRKIEELYRTKGYNDVEVTIIEGSAPEHRKAVYSVHEGQQQIVREVDFVGNKIVSAARLRTLVATKKPIALLFGGKFKPDDVQADVDKLTAYYHGLGYWDVRIGREVEMKDATFNSSQASVHVTYVIDEGIRFKVRNTSIIGNHKLKTDELNALVQLKRDQFFDQPSLQKDIKALKDAYGGQGYVYCDVRADARFLEEPGVLDVVFQIQEGARYRIGRVDVQIGGDNPHTKITAVLNRISVRPGDVADTRELAKSERRLKASGLFRNDPQRNISPKIVYTPAEDADGVQLASGQQNARGQSPDLPPGDRWLIIAAQGEAAPPGQPVVEEFEEPAPAARPAQPAARPTQPRSELPPQSYHPAPREPLPYWANGQRRVVPASGRVVAAVTASPSGPAEFRPLEPFAVTPGQPDIRYTTDSRFHAR